MDRSNWSKRHTQISKAKLRDRIEAYSVHPFGDAIAFLLGCRPTTKDVQDWANKNPDKWANAISIFAKLYGFAEFKVIDHNHHFDVSKMSDSEVEQRLEMLRQALVPTNGINTSNSGLKQIEGQATLYQTLDEKIPPEEQSSPSEGIS